MGQRLQRGKANGAAMMDDGVQTNVRNGEQLSVQSVSDPRGRVRVHAHEDFRLEDHICRGCFGRIASRPGDRPEDALGSRIYRCTNCGQVESGHQPSVICACGTKVRKATASGRSGLAVVDAGIRCHVNPAPTPEFPSEIVASEMTK